MSDINNDYKKELRPLYQDATTMTIDGSDLHIDNINGRNQVMSNRRVSCPHCFHEHTPQEFWTNPNERSELFNAEFYCSECKKYFEVSTCIEKILYISEVPYNFEEPNS